MICMFYTLETEKVENWRLFILFFQWYKTQKSYTIIFVLMLFDFSSLHAQFVWKKINFLSNFFWQKTPNKQELNSINLSKFISGHFELVVCEPNTRVSHWLGLSKPHPTCVPFSQLAERLRGNQRAKGSIHVSNAGLFSTLFYKEEVECFHLLFHRGMQIGGWGILRPAKTMQKIKQFTKDLQRLS